VKLGVELPATAWSDTAGTVPCDRLAAEPIADLRSRVEKLTAGLKPGGAHRPPAEGAGDSGSSSSSSGTGDKEFTLANGVVVKLSAREVAMCDELKVKPEAYAAQKAGKKS